MQRKLSDDELRTGELFGGLFTAFDMENYLRSIDMFRKRFENNGFDLEYFRNKTCLDIGCGGGRYSIALSKLGAKSVSGVDISERAITDAKRRAKALDIDNVNFARYSGEALPFENETFEVVVFSGVLMHMDNPERGMAEISRILKRGGMVYSLVYATEGVRWPLINILRNISSYIGFDKFDRVLGESGLDVNKRRTYLDDLFVPNIDFYSWKRLKGLLELNGFHKIDRWEKGRLDHEESLNAYYQDILKLCELFKTGADSDKMQESDRTLFRNGVRFCESSLQFIDSVRELNSRGLLSDQASQKIVIGQGHHRFVAFKIG